MNYLVIGDHNGKMTLRLIERGVNPSDIFVWDNSTKGRYSVIIEGATVTDNLNDFDGMHFDVIIGNPPYGNRGSDAVRFLNKSLEMSDDVRFILPLSFTKPSITNQVSLSHKCVEQHILPDDTFPNGIRTVYQRWIPSEQRREKIVLPTTHSDFEFVKYVDRFDADLMIGAVGSGPSGRVKTTDFTHYQSKHHFIKCKNEQVKQVLISMEEDLRSLSKQQNGRGGICKSDIVTLYTLRTR